MTHRQARRKLGSRTTRRAGTKTQNIPGAQNSGKGPTIQYAHPRRHPRVPTLAARVWGLVNEQTKS